MGILRSRYIDDDEPAAEEIDLDVPPESSRKPPESSPERAAGRKPGRKRGRKGPMTLADLAATSQEIRGDCETVGVAEAAPVEMAPAAPEAPAPEIAAVASADDPEATPAPEIDPTGLA